MLAHRTSFFSRRSLLAVVAGSLLVAGCSHAKPAATGPLPAPAPLLEQSSAHTKDQTSVHILITTNGEVPGLPLKTLDGDLTSKPEVAAKGKAGILLGKPSDPATTLQFIVVGDQLYSAIGGKWSSPLPVQQIYPIGNILDPNVGLANIVGHIKNPVAEGREEVGGVQAVRIAGSVDADVLKGIFPKADHELPAKAWVREDGNHELVQALIQVTPNAGIELTVSKWGEPVSVAKPV